MVRKYGRWLFAMTSLVLLLPSTSMAQPRGSWFAGMAAFVDHDAPSAIEANLTAGLGAEVGYLITPRYSLRVEVSVPGWHGGDAIGGSITGRVVAYSLLTGVSFRQGQRVQPAILLGLSALRETSRGSSGSFSNNVESESALTGGIDVPIRLSEHADLVAGFRLYVAVGPHEVTGVWVRPQALVRWTF